MVTHSSILAWKIPWMEEPGRLRSMGLQRLGHSCVHAGQPAPRSPSGGYLYESVLGTEARVGGGGARVHRADVLSGPGLVTVQVKPVALGTLP